MAIPHMPSDLVITEKTSQAKDVRAAVGGRYGAVLPAEGHLLTLREPEEVDPAWKRWSPVLLRPDGLYGTKPASGGNKPVKLQAIRAALKTARRVWIATDCDREGQLIGQEILEHCRYRGEVMRVMFTAQDPQTIRDAFARARPNSEYGRLYGAAVARQQADQIYNLTLTRTATVTLGRGERAVIGVGRVKTPTLAIVCRRELEIRAFVPQTYYEVVATAQVEAGCFEMRHAPKERILQREEAEAIAAKADGFAGPLAVRVEEKRQAPPRLHDLPSLQKLCGSRFGWSAEKTLAVAQELYDGEGKKVITYPRAETRYLPESLIPDVPRIVAGLMAGQTFRAIPVPDQPIIRRGKAGHFWDKGLEGASHHAVIPNVNTIRDLPGIWPRLSPDERRLFLVIARSTLAALMPDFRYRQTTALLDVAGHPFRAVGRQPIELGWRAAFGEEDEDKPEEGSQLLPPLRDGDPARLTGPKVEAKEPKPPPRYNEGTLVEAMQNAWRFVEDPALQERLKEAKGIGTPATRAEIIKGLKHQDFLTTQGKHIVPTERGLALFGILERADPALVDPGVTAQFEVLLDEILVGRQQVEGAIDAICRQAARILDRLVGSAGSIAGAGPGATAPADAPSLPRPARPPSPAMRKFVEGLAARLKLKPPRGYTKSAELCRQFLDRHAPKRPEGSDTGGSAAPGPSAAQQAFAERIARDRGITVPEEARASARSLSAWIDANKARVGRQPATRKGRFSRPERQSKAPVP
ncbi:DNA topoisomerase [Roseicella aerolata]|uniref:DNA topoisomerase n=1 Tax=Roseicella aerolata TaxID=2883479 RepID=A0A9X1IFL4_9PROT|nr:DNA topoisomerase [Roseicella aerolata]MCB4823291.1 DNA topoisomerase III [Roseicella aerolata]